MQLAGKDGHLVGQRRAARHRDGGLFAVYDAGSLGRQQRLQRPEFRELSASPAPGYIFHDVMQWSAKHYNWDPNSTFQMASDLAMADFNCNTGLAPYKGSVLKNLQCQFAPVPAPTCKTKVSPYCGKDPYNQSLDAGYPSWIGRNYGEDRDLYVVRQNWVQS